MHLIDHQIDETLLKKHSDLGAFWGIPVFDCTPLAARLVLYYDFFEKNLRETRPVGKAIFYWDRKKASRLYLTVNYHRSHVDYTIIVSKEGILAFQGEAYSHPLDILKKLTLEKHIIHYLVSIPEASSLGKLLGRKFNESCSLYFPPDCPPLLLHIALANQDFATSKALLDHPFIKDEQVATAENRRLIPMLETALAASIDLQEELFFEFLINTYPIYKVASLYTKGIEAAISLRRIKFLEKLIAKCPREQLAIAYNTALSKAIEKRVKQMVVYLLQNLSVGIAPLAKSLPIELLATFYINFGPKLFNQFVNQFGIVITWEPFITLLLAKGSDPRGYLPLYLSAGNSLEELSEDQIANFILQLLKADPRQEALENFLVKFFPEKECQELLSVALLKAIEQKIFFNVLLEAGAIPTKIHFEALLRQEDNEEQRYQHFISLLEAVKDITAAKNTLSIASAFGKKAIEKTFERFPSLVQDQVFLADFLAEVWKGSQAEADRLLRKAMAPSPELPSLDASQKEPGFSYDFERNLLSLSTSYELLGEHVMEGLLSNRQVDRISKFLKGNPRSIDSFWWKAIFSEANFQDKEWEQLSKETFTQLPSDRQMELIGLAFYYSHLQLASLWIATFPQRRSEVIFSWYAQALNSKNHQSIQVFAKHDLLKYKNGKEESFLFLASEQNATEFVEALIEHQESINPKDLLASYELAFSHQHLTICRLLKGALCYEEIAQHLLNKKSQKLEEWLLQAYLNSSYVDVQLLITHLRKLSLSSNQGDVLAVCDSVESFSQACGPLIVRYPFPNYQVEVYQHYGRAYPSYLIQQKSWGQECYQKYNNLLKEYQKNKQSLLELFLNAAKVQASKKEYGTWRMGSSINLKTPFKGRYFFFWHIARNMFKELTQEPEKFQDELQCTEEGYQVLYKINDAVIPLSSFPIKRPFSLGKFKGEFYHTPASHLALLVPHLDQLLKEIASLSTASKGGEKHDSELKRKIALFFWLGCHLVISLRGNSQYMLMLHKLLYEIHGFSSYSWSIKFIQPDCIAIMLPFSLFYNKFYEQLFER